MTLAVWIYFGVTCAIGVWCSVRGVVVWLRGRRDAPTLHAARRWSITGSDPMAERGVSIVVAEECPIEQLLAVDYLRAEVIVVGDVARSEWLRGVVARYSMVRMGAPVVEPHLQRSSRGIYRSRKARLRRVVVVDSVGESFAERVDAGIAVRSFDLVLPLEGGVALSPEALRIMLWRMVESGAEIVTARLRGGGRVAVVDGDLVAGMGGFHTLGVGRELLRKLRQRGVRADDMMLFVGRGRAHREERAWRIGVRAATVVGVVLIVAQPRLWWVTLMGGCSMVVGGVTRLVAWWAVEPVPLRRPRLGKLLGKLLVWREKMV